MSYKSIVNNKRKEISWCVTSENNWTSGYTTGHGIPDGYCIMSCAHYVGNYKFIHNENYGKLIKIEDYEKMAYERGIIVPYFRNSVKFVMSRAARKRGYTTNDYLYESRKKWKYSGKRSK